MPYKLSEDKNFLIISTPNYSPFTGLFGGPENTRKVFVRKDSEQYKKWHKEAMKYAKTHQETKDYDVVKIK